METRIPIKSKMAPIYKTLCVNNDTDVSQRVKQVNKKNLEFIPIFCIFSACFLFNKLESRNYTFFKCKFILNIIFPLTFQL